jgi:hypothetical protein
MRAWSQRVYLTERDACAHLTPIIQQAAFYSTHIMQRRSAFRSNRMLHNPPTFADLDLEILRR